MSNLRPGPFVCVRMVPTRGGRRWVVTVGDDRQPRTLPASQAEALEWGKGLAQQHDGQLLVEGPDGHLRPPVLSSRRS
jgi:hypothetical protein